MACMEHVCTKCGHTTFDNSRDGGVCPKCGNDEWQNFFDEDDDDRD